MSSAEFSARFAQDLTATLVVLDLFLVVGTLGWVLHTKRETMSAIAWSLTVILLPFGGAVLFFLFGAQSVKRPVERNRKTKSAYKRLVGSKEQGQLACDVPERWDNIARLGHYGDGFPVVGGNAVTLYHDGHPAYDAMIDAIRGAKHHVHIQFFIVRNDASGRRFIDALCERAKAGVEVRFLFDSVGSYWLKGSLKQQLRDAGGQVRSFLPVFNPFYKFRVNLRNHRKIVVVDGRVAFTGGLNLGDEYLGLHPNFGPWRDTHLRVEGPAAEHIQRVFLEDWHFAAGEAVTGDTYFPKFDKPPGTSLVQVASSGPDSDYKTIREGYFAGILNARKRVWIASPYFVPDAGIRDALILAARSGVDVRLLGLFRPDKWVPFLAARFYWADVMATGVKVYQYTPGMMHSKYMLVDGEWASVGSANMDNRSLLLNYEANCQLYDAALVEELEREFLKDLEVSVRIDPAVFADRPLVSRVGENACRLFSPVL